MTLAWSQDWMDKEVAGCQADAHFNDEAEAFDRSVVLHILADPERGVAQDRWVGFNPPYMTETWTGTENKNPNADYVIEGTYQDWWAVNEGKKGLVASLLDQSILLRAGSTSYIAMFVPGVDRFFDISRELTTEYEGDYKTER